MKIALVVIAVVIVLIIVMVIIGKAYLYVLDEVGKYYKKPVPIWLLFLAAAVPIVGFVICIWPKETAEFLNFLDS